MQSCDYHVIIMMIVMMIRLSTHSVVSSVTRSHVIGTWFTYSTLGSWWLRSIVCILYSAKFGIKFRSVNRSWHIMHAILVCSVIMLMCNVIMLHWYY